MTNDDLIRRGVVIDRLDLAEHDAEERDWRSGANEIARLRKYVAALPAVTPQPTIAAALALPEIAAMVEALQIAKAHVANNAQGWSVGRVASSGDLEIIETALRAIEGADK